MSLRTTTYPCLGPLELVKVLFMHTKSLKVSDQIMNQKYMFSWQTLKIVGFLRIGDCGLTFYIAIRADLLYLPPSL